LYWERNAQFRTFSVACMNSFCTAPCSLYIFVYLPNVHVWIIYIQMDFDTYQLFISMYYTYAHLMELNCTRIFRLVQWTACSYYIYLLTLRESSFIPDYKLSCSRTEVLGLGSFAIVNQLHCRSFLKGFLFDGNYNLIASNRFGLLYVSTAWIGISLKQYLTFSKK